MTAPEWLESFQLQFPNNRGKYIVKFVFLWMGYNKWYNKEWPKESGDKSAALNLANNQIAQNVYQEMAGSLLDSFSGLSSYNCEQGERDKLYQDEINQSVVCFNRRCGKDRLSDFLAVIYQIRCNFFHWNKSGDQIDEEVIVWAYNAFLGFSEKLKERGLEIIL